MSEPDNGGRDRSAWRGGLYGLYLRHHGYTPHEAAEAVARRYWSTRDKLAPLLRQRPTTANAQEHEKEREDDSPRANCAD